jgi:hypothetical protein
MLDELKQKNIRDKPDIGYGFRHPAGRDASWDERWQDPLAK